MSKLKPNFFVLSPHCFVDKTKFPDRPSCELIVMKVFHTLGHLNFYTNVDLSQVADAGTGIRLDWSQIKASRPKLLIVDQVLNLDLPDVEATVHLVKLWHVAIPECQIVVLCKGGNMGNREYLKRAGAAEVWQWKQLRDGGDEYVKEFLRKNFSE